MPAAASLRIHALMNSTWKRDRITVTRCPPDHDVGPEITGWILTNVAALRG